MTPLESFSIILFVSYSVFIIVILSGIFKKKQHPVPGTSEKRVSVLIPFKDEEKSLPHLFSALEKQDHPFAEIIFINDHSQDSSVNILQAFAHPKYKVKIFHLSENESGKKKAIETGIRESSYGFILTTDADCTFSEKWISSHAKAFDGSSQVHSGRVEIESKSGFWNSFQQLEMISIQSVSIGLGNLRIPISMSGANLSYTKEIFVVTKPYEKNSDTLSGDDIYFLQALKKSGTQIEFLDSPDNTVTTTSQSPGVYWKQRIRWMKKGSSFSDLATVFTGLLIFLSSFVFIFLTGYQLFTGEWSRLLLISGGLKIIVDFLLLFLVTTHWKKTRLLIWFLPVFLINVFFTTLIPVFGWWIPVSWKGRKI